MKNYRYSLSKSRTVVDAYGNRNVIHFDYRDRAGVSPVASNWRRRMKKPSHLRLGFSLSNCRTKLLSASYFLAPRIASFAALATRNLRTLVAGLAEICIGSPVAGLRPILAGRAGRVRTTSLPTPTSVKLFLASL